jgi:hypothetical protein
MILKRCSQTSWPVFGVLKKGGPTQTLDEQFSSAHGIYWRAQKRRWSERPSDRQRRRTTAHPAPDNLMGTEASGHWVLHKPIRN